MEGQGNLPLFSSVHRAWMRKEVMKYKVTEIVEVMREWYVEADSEELAEMEVYSALEPDSEIEEQVKLTVSKVGD